MKFANGNAAAHNAIAGSLLLVASLCISVNASEEMTVKIEFMVNDVNQIGAAGFGNLQGRNRKSFHRIVQFKNNQPEVLAKERREYDVMPACHAINLDWVNKDLTVGFVEKDGVDIFLITGWLESTPYYDYCRPINPYSSENVDRIREQVRYHVNNHFELKKDEIVTFDLATPDLPTRIRVTRFR